MPHLNSETKLSFKTDKLHISILYRYYKIFVLVVARRILKVHAKVYYFFSDIPDAKARAMDNLGRVYARMGKFEKAIEV